MNTVERPVPGGRFVFAVDQEPFEASGHRFSLLYPLLSLGGERIQDLTASFPNRGRCWWLITEDCALSHVRPGAIWVGRIEHALRYDPDGKDKDLFQIEFRTVHPAGAEVYEVIDVPERVPDLAALLADAGRPYARIPSRQVFVRGKERTIGPLLAELLTAGRICFRAPKPAQPEVLDLATADFNQLVRTEEFQITLQEHDRYLKPIRTRFALAPADGVDLDELRAIARTRDASTDAQILNWGFRRLGVTRQSGQLIKDVVARIGNDVEAANTGEDAQRLERFREIAGSAQRVVEAGEEIAALVATVGSFQTLLDKHADRLVEKRVEEATSQRRAEVDAQVAAHLRTVASLKHEIESLQKVYAARLEEIDGRVREEHASRIAALEQMAGDVTAREEALRQRESEIEQRLQRLIEAYRKEGERVGDAVLAQLPILRRAGLLGPSDSPAATPRDKPALRLPSFLDIAKEGAPLSEAEFLDQFKDVVRRRGFQFRDADLINFHSCMKAGGLTVLAGPSGTGKSSLPRLYAEALGSADEFLLVPVRPDWLDDRDVVGAFNALSGRFEPSASGLVDRLIAAQVDAERSRGGLYFCVLDEMNLARVEHYFAQFLSLLEAPPALRQVRLFAAGLARSDDPYAPHRMLPVGDNFRFVGTVNIDETTHFFSPKMLDRSYVISFPRPDPMRESQPVDIASTLGGVTPIRAETYASWIRPPEEARDIREVLARIEETLATSGMSLGYRVPRRILSYVACARPHLSDDAALDFQVLQSVLPKLRRSSPRVSEAVQGLRKLLPADRFPRTSAMLDRLDESGVEDDFLQLL